MRRKLALISLVSWLILISGVVPTKAQQQGKIVAVNEYDRSVLLEVEAEIEEYQLAPGATIKLNGQEAKLAKLKPRAGRKFIPVKVGLNQSGQIKRIKAVCRLVPIVVKANNGRTIIIKELTTGQLEEVLLTEDLRLRKNNQLVNGIDPAPGARGSALFGFNGRLEELDFYHYQ